MSRKLPDNVKLSGLQIFSMGEKPFVTSLEMKAIGV